MKRDSDIFNLTSESVKGLAVLSCADRPRGVADKGFDGVAEIRVGGRAIREPYVVRSTVTPYRGSKPRKCGITAIEA